MNKAKKFAAGFVHGFLRTMVVLSATVFDPGGIIEGCD
jgi:hypothetical protein